VWIVAIFADLKHCSPPSHCVEWTWSCWNGFENTPQTLRACKGQNTPQLKLYHVHPLHYGRSAEPKDAMLSSKTAGWQANGKFHVPCLSRPPVIYLRHYFTSPIVGFFGTYLMCLDSGEHSSNSALNPLVNTLRGNASLILTDGRMVAWFS